MLQDTAPTLRARARRAFDWAFRSRETGKVAIVQLPNTPLALFLLLRGAELLLSPSGTVGSVLHWTGTLALAWWAVDEVARGVCPFRRALGGAVLALLLVSVVTALVT